MKTNTIIIVLFLSLFFIIHDAQSQDQGTAKPSGIDPQGTDMPSMLDNAITVKLKEGVGDFSRQSGSVRTGIQSMDEKISRFEVQSLEKRFRYNPDKLRKDMPDLSRIYKISFPKKYSIDQVVKAFSEDPNVEYAEAIPLNYPNEYIPDDALYSQCQHLPQIFAEEAWEIHHGEDGPEIVVAIVDNGVDWDHIDLRENIWQNLGEDADNDGKTLEFIGGAWVFDPGDINNIDDDGNGFTDDFIGWDIIEDDNDPDHNSGEYHGTHCCGIAAGVTNNGIGIASISWNIKAMPIQVAVPGGTFDGAYEGIIYAAENGADIISNSWSAKIYSQANQEVITYATQLGCIIVAAAANENTNINVYPASNIGVVSVASVNLDDTKANYSNFGPAVDISAPGGGIEGGILSTMPGNSYAPAWGTSMATPLVAGCFGLLKSYHPEWSIEQLITKVLGTADIIDSINPGYENLLGSGRVNALSLMSLENITVPEVLKIDLISLSTEDANGNHVNEPGEEVTLNVEFRNYVHFAGDDDATATLSTEDPEITILVGSATVAIPPDGVFAIEDQFQFLVSEDATPHMAVLTISFGSEFEITWGQEQSIEVLVAPGGVFVFEGEENAGGYSGTYIKEVFDQLGIQYIYSNTYPPTLLGFENVFVSHSNVGEDQLQGIGLTEAQSLMFQEFLENGGNLFVDMGNMFSIIDYFNYSNGAAMKSLFGVLSNTIHFTSNPLDSLYGMPGSVMEGIHFTQSNQPHSWYIDDLELTGNAIAAFTESDYGIVSAMHDGAATFGQKTFYTAYALADFTDVDPINSRNNVLLKVLDFFEILPEDYALAGFISDIHDGPIGMQVQFTDLSLSDPDWPILSWEWDFDSDGEIDSYEQNPSETFNDPGEYDITLIVTNEVSSDTLTKHAFITVNHGILVYEGVSEGEGYSGTFIRNYMEENAFYGVNYHNDFPESLEGYYAVFLSFGTYNSGNTILEDHMADVIIDYLEGGGYVYLEGGDAIGFDQGDNSELQGQFGLQGAEDGSTNPIDYLEGENIAITADQVFTSSKQLTFDYIDIYIPDESGIVAFEESDYGTVAVQNTGEYNQRTFCFSYTLADLNDGESPGTRNELLERICNFFDIYVGVDPPGEERSAIKIYPNPVSNSATFSSERITSAEIYDIMGKLVRRNNCSSVDMSNLSPGMYFVVGFDKTGNPLYKGKIIKN